jgi:hypothetical protein
VWSNAVHGVQSLGADCARSRGADCFVGDEGGGGDQNSFLGATLTFKDEQLKDERFKDERFEEERFKEENSKTNGNFFEDAKNRVFTALGERDEGVEARRLEFNRGVSKQRG